MKNEKPMISVVVPVYNAEDCLKNCLDSIVAQSYSHLEIILVNDASTDKSGRICDAYATRDSRFRAVHFPVNKGPSAARNEGIRRAAGSFVCFIDADDYVEPDLLEKLYNNLTENGADISACGADGIRIKDGPAAVYTGREAIFCLAQSTPFNLVPWGKLYRIEFVKNNLFDESVFYSEDLLFLYSVLGRVKKVSYFPDKLYHYVCREGSQVHSGIGRRKYTALSVQDFICRDASENFPEAVPYFEQMALDINLRMAILTVKNGALDEPVQTCLKRFCQNARRHFNRKSFALCQSKKDALSLLILCFSEKAFWLMASFYYKAAKPKNGR